MLAGYREEVLLHLDVGVDAAPQQFGHGDGRRDEADPLLDAVQHDVGFLLRQVEQDALRLNEAGGAFDGQFGEDRHG